MKFIIQLVSSFLKILFGSSNTNYDFYYCEKTGAMNWAFLDYLMTTKDNFLLCHKSSNPYFLMGTKTKSEYLDIENATKNQIGIVRLPFLKGVATSILYCDTDVLFFNLISTNEIKNIDINLQIIKDTFVKLGIQSEIDVFSNQRNDILIDGKKYSGILEQKIDNKYYYGFFITLNIDKKNLSYLKLPLAKFKGKPIEKVEDRVSDGLKTIKPNLTSTEVTDAFIEVIQQTLKFITTIKKKDITGKNIDWQSIKKKADKMTANNFIYSK